MKKYPRVGILCPIVFNIPPDKYGPWELVCYNLSEALVKLSVDVTIFATKKARTSAKLEYLFEKPLSNFDQVNEANFANIHAIDALKKAKNLDIIHNHLNITPVLYAKLIDIPIITTLHGAASEKQNADYFNYLKNSRFVSLSMAERKLYPDLNYIDTVYNGVDFDRYSLKNNKNEYLVFSGRIVKEKGILSAIEIAKKTKIPLKIAGIITDKEFYNEHVNPHIDGKLIQYVGNLNSVELSSLLADALALILMAEYNDACPLSVLDALASGLPVIGSIMGSLPELIYNSHLGIIVNNVDEAVERIDEIYSINPITCRKNARSKFSREVMAQRYLDNYIKFA